MKDRFIEIYAQATASKNNKVTAFLEGYGVHVNIPEEIRYLIMRGINSYMKGVDNQERIQQRILELNPNHYKEIRQAIEEKEATPQGQRALKTRQHKELKSKEEAKRIHENFSNAMNTLNVALTLYENWKVAGIPLGECTREHLLKNAKREAKTADTHDANSQFYTKLALQLKPKQKVKDAINIEDAHKIRETVYLSKPHYKNAA